MKLLYLVLNLLMLVRKKWHNFTVQIMTALTRGLSTGSAVRANGQ